MIESPHLILSTLLTESDARLTAEEVLSMIPGVVAAPGNEDGVGDADSWVDLVAENPSPELVTHLTSLIENARKSENSSLIFPCPSEKRLSHLRKELNRQNLDGFIIPVADEHQGEYVPKCAQRLAWITGFTGSAGVAVILKNVAAIFIDGRYTLQTAHEVNKNVFEIMEISNISPGKWIRSKTSSRDSLGYDPWLHTANDVRRLKKAIGESGAKLIAVEVNAVDIIWPNQPAKPLSPIKILEIKFSGRATKEKILDIAKHLEEIGCDAVILTSPASIAWLSNLRGGDVPYTPFTLAFGILYADSKLEIFVDLRKVSPSIAERIKDEISLRPISEFDAALNNLGKKSPNVLIDPSSAAEAIYLALKRSGANLIAGDDPCVLPKSCKNDVELVGIRAAHRRDGLALTRFLAWLSRNAIGYGETEMSAAQCLENYRREGKHMQGLSFPTISGSGPNGAIIHYRVTEKTNQPLKIDNLYLVDSGAQYFDGTTDVTRTIVIGTPTSEMKDRFTRVLCGHIALAMAIFPEGTTGSQLDVLARTPLWQVGLDYDHGTGHGVGHYLGVHEGPQRISKSPNQVALKPGMIISNEPGYYKTGAYGIRIENLIVVKAIKTVGNNDSSMLGFDTLTIAPIDLALVERSLLSDDEVAWLNFYHSKVFETHKESLKPIDREWLKNATQPI